MTDIFAKVKKAYELSREIQNVELKEVIADLKSDVVNLKEELSKAQKERLRLEKELEKLRKERDLRSKLEYKNGLYYLSEPVEGLSEGPFCPTCWEDEEKTITVTPYYKMSLGAGNMERVRAGWQCPRCKIKISENS